MRSVPASLFGLSLALAACHVDRTVPVSPSDRAMAVQAVAEAAPAAQTRVYRCHRAEAMPPLQGDFTDGPWAQAEWTEDFLPARRTGPETGIRTRAKLLWDDAYLYCAIEMAEPPGPAPDDALAVRHNVDLLVARSGDEGGYQIELVAMSSIIDSWFAGPRMHRSRDAYWDAEGLQTLVCRRKDAADGRWTAGFALPWRSLRGDGAVDGAASGGAPPVAGSAWRVDLGRSTWRPMLRGRRAGTGQTAFERTVWQTPGEPGEPDGWGLVEFLP